MKGMVRKELGRDVGMSNIVVVMDEGTSFGASDEEVPLQDSMDIENQSLMLKDKGEKPLDKPSIYVVVNKDWHHVASPRENQ